MLEGKWRPERIRTSDPQIRSLRKIFEAPHLFCNPSTNKPIMDQWVSPNVANRAELLPSQKNETAAPAGSRNGGNNGIGHPSTLPFYCAIPRLLQLTPGTDVLP